jgi:hypothetical protein
MTSLSPITTGRPVSILHSTIILMDASPANPKGDEYQQYLSASGQAKGLNRR